MKTMKKYLSLFIVALMLVVTSCNIGGTEQETESDSSMSAPIQDEPAPKTQEATTDFMDKTGKDYLLNGSISNHVDEIIVYLLEHASDFTDEEIASIYEVDGSNFKRERLYFYQWYLERGLNRIKVDVLDIELIAAYTWSNYRSGVDYLLKVDILDTVDGSDIVPGEQEWIFTYGHVDETNSVLSGPAQLITYDEYQTRMVNSRYNNEIVLLQHFRSICSQEAFDSPLELPEGLLLSFVQRFLESDRTYTLDEANETAQDLLGINLKYDHDIYNKDGALLYDKETDIVNGFSSAGGGYSLKFRQSVDYYWRVDEDDNNLYIYCFHPEMPLKYTMRDGKIISAVSIIDDITKWNLGQINLNL